MEDEHISTILEMESDEVIKSSVENLVHIPSEFEVTSDNDNNGESIPTKIDPHYFNVESNLIKSLLNRDTLIGSFSKFDYLLELTHIDAIPSRIEEADFDLEEEIRDIYFLEELLSNDPFSLPENESSNFDHHDDPLFPRPPPEPPDVEIFFDFEPDTVVLTAK
nr:hypothetical protein [Tanacetum cinerariifolium]